MTTSQMNNLFRAIKNKRAWGLRNTLIWLMRANGYKNVATAQRCIRVAMQCEVRANFPLI